MNNDRIRLPNNNRTRMPDARARPAKIGSPRWVLRLVAWEPERATACCTALKSFVSQSEGVPDEAGTPDVQDQSASRARRHMVPGTSFCQAARIALCTLVGSGM